MNVTADQVGAVRAFLTRDTETHRRISERLDPAGKRAHGALIAAAFFLAAERRFKDKNASQVTDFVAQLRARPGLAEKIDPGIAERLILATVADEDVDDIGAEEQGIHFGILLAGMTADASDPELDNLLEDARQLADEWLAD